MNYDIKLYVHGVPNGQGTWGVENFDTNYIETFYGRKSNVPVQMFVEVRRFASSTYCYYTYFRIGNVYDNTGRAGSYFALTIRVNYYYADIQNIYNLLDAAYNKFIIGSIVDVNEGVIKYLITDFVQEDITLKSLEQEINKYLMQFSSDSDFIPLSGFKVNGQSEPASVNLLECDARIIASHVKNNGSISISSLHPSTRIQQVIQEMTAKVNAVNAQAQKQISEAQQNAQRDVNAAREQAQQDVAAAIHDKEAGIMAIRKEYKDADKTINSLRAEIDKANKEIASLCESKKELNQRLQKAEAYKNKYDEAKKDLDNKNECLTKIGEVYSVLSAKSEVKAKNPKLHDVEDKRSEILEKEGKGLLLIKLIHKLHPYLIIIPLLLIILVNTCSDKNAVHAGAEVSDSKVDSKSDLFPIGKDDFVEESSESNMFKVNEQAPQRSLKEVFPNAKIDIADINPQKPMKYGNGKSYTVSLRLNGEWVSNDFNISDNHITPKESGECTIAYIVGNDTLVTRTINVK